MMETGRGGGPAPSLSRFGSFPAMRRASILGLVAVTSTLATGCGGSSASGADATAVTRTYNTYIAAVKSGDGRAACDLLTPAFQRRASKLVTPRAHAKLRGASCPQAITQGTLPQLQRFKPLLERIRVSGSRASGFNPGQGPFGPQKVLFRRLGGDWKISATIYRQPH
jgi:hypothetical protein